MQYMPITIPVFCTFSAALLLRRIGSEIRIVEYSVTWYSTMYVRKASLATIVKATSAIQNMVATLKPYITESDYLLIHLSTMITHSLGPFGKAILPSKYWKYAFLSWCLPYEIGFLQRYGWPQPYWSSGRQ